MAPAKAQDAPKRRRKAKPRVKKDSGALQPNAKQAIRTGHVVFVGRVPSALCASESAVKDFFGEYGTLQSVTIHHNFLDMDPDGFLYLEYAEKEEAEAAVAAVKDKTVGSTVSITAKSRKAVRPSTITGMQASLALRREEPRVEVDEEMKDLLLGRHEGNRFSQSQQEQAMDEEDLILQSLSQHSFAHSQPKKKKKKKRRRASDEPAAAEAEASPKPKKKAKKAKKTRSNKVAIPTE
ncbi:DNA binding protein [Phytophthora cinnamomi]|uniref:DNA binding protein n=1 Tax=Phytophthora cinnamomi TaxID=4785 RepID=UPI00355A006C|nr:DNA binding protein [Phytophthora cinnamomi]